jgi:glutaconate CoA-transferase subunit A
LRLSILGPDPYFDDLFLMAARRRVVSCERVVENAELHERGVFVPRIWTDVLVEAPRGAGFTSCDPDYGRDDAALRSYVEAQR